MRQLYFASIVSSLIALGASQAVAHCQVPCGIYDDAGRIKMMLEDTTTIGKAIDQITQLSRATLAGEGTPTDINQITRWINTKEEHASNIIQIVSEYFLTQKVKPVAANDAGYEEYLKSLADHHAVLRAAMTTKQTVDPAAAKSLEAAIQKLAKHYE